MTSNYTTWTFLDNSGEKSNVRVFNGEITNLTIAAYVTGWMALEAALEDITLGTVHQRVVNASQTVLSQTLPASTDAQRENKWLVTYQGDTSLKLFRFEIPTADLSSTHLYPNQDEADLTDADMAAFVSAFEAIGRSPDDEDETVTVTSIRHVGRNI